MVASEAAHSGKLAALGLADIPPDTAAATVTFVNTGNEIKESFEISWQN